MLKVLRTIVNLNDDNGDIGITRKGIDAESKKNIKIRW